MFKLAEKIEAFAQKAPAATLFRAVLQRDLNPERMDKLFNDTAQLQYERKLLFSTMMMLMVDVILKSVPNLNRAYLLHQEKIPVTIKALYNKVNGLEPRISRELVQDSFKNLAPVVDQLEATNAPLLPGFRTLILDGNHFAATKRRLKELRNRTAAPLPGQVLALYDPQYEMVCDVVPCEDGHAQERTLLGPILEQIQPKDCIVADRNFCTLSFFSGIESRGGFFVIRHHGQLKHWKEKSEKELIGIAETGKVYEQSIDVEQAKSGVVLQLRRITLELDRKTRDGDSEIHLLTNLSREDVSAIMACRLYRNRWSIEGMFLDLTQSLQCEIDTLAYPRAAVFAFCLAVKAFNAVSLVRASLRSRFGESSVEEVSWYHLCSETSSVWAGMEIAVEWRDWSHLIDGLSPLSYAELLKELAGRLKLSKYKRVRRGVKKPSQRKTGDSSHLSTARILAERGRKKQKPKRK